MYGGQPLTGTGGEYIDENGVVQKRGMGSKIKGAFHDIKTALIGDKQARDLRQEEVITGTTLQPTTV